jgi:hypothetical protein
MFTEGSSEETIKRKFVYSRKKLLITLSIMWFFSGLFVRINEGISGLFSLFSLSMTLYIIFLGIRRSRRVQLPRKKKFISTLGLAFTLIGASLIAPIGLGISESIKPLTKQEIDDRAKAKSLEIKKTQENAKESNKEGASNTKEKIKKACNPSEFDNCIVKGALSIKSFSTRDSFDPSRGFLCTKFEASYKNLTSQKIVGLKGYFVMYIYFKEPLSSKMVPGRYVLSDEYTMPRWFAYDRKIMNVEIKPGETYVRDGEYCDATASELSTPLVHLRKMTNDPWEMKYVLDEVAFENGENQTFDSFSWLRDLCTTDDLARAILGGGGILDCKVDNTWIRF